jgi:hypothetical protein
MKRVRICVLILMGLCCGDCKEPYPIKTTAQDGLLVVDGAITDSPGPYFMTLALTNLPGLKPLPLANAMISITDELGNSEAYFEVAKGKYQLNGTTVYGRPGGSYTVNITLKNGRQYRSTTEVLPSVPKAIDATSIEVVNDKFINNIGQEVNRWQVHTYLDTTLPSNKNGRFRWSVSEVWNLFPTCYPGSISCPQICYIFQPVSTYNLVVINVKDYASTQLNNLSLMSRGVDLTFNGRHYFNVTQYSMNEGAYDYWSRVSDLLNKRGSVFDTPPSVIVGNITCLTNAEEIAYGYFEASGTQVTRNFIDRGVIPTYVESCFFYAPDFNPFYVNNYCFNCSILPGSTFAEPDWFW